MAKIDTNRFQWHDQAWKDPIWWLGVAEVCAFMCITFGAIVALIFFFAQVKMRSKYKATTRKEAWLTRLRDVMISLAVWPATSFIIFVVFALSPLALGAFIVWVLGYIIVRCCTVESLEDETVPEDV